MVRGQMESSAATPTGTELTVMVPKHRPNWRQYERWIGDRSDVTVLVVDDQRLVREGIASLLDIQDGIQVIGQAVNGQEAIEKALALNPDVILMDVRMPVLDGILATAQIHRQLPGCRVIMLTTFDDEEYVIKSLRAGAVGYLLKDIPASNWRTRCSSPTPASISSNLRWPASWSACWADSLSARRMRRRRHGRRRPKTI